MADLLTVLHVDDDPSFGQLTTTFLEREDDRFSVETATSADEGLAIISDRPPDCVVSDYNMPGMDGLEFLRAVRETHPDLPFVLFTGKGSEEVASDAIAAGVTDYIQKGGGSEQYELLANRIENAVRSRREAERADRQEELICLTEFVGDTGGFEVDIDTGEVLMTDGVRRLVGLPDDAEISLEEAIGYYHPGDQANLRQSIIRVAETGERTRNVWRLQTLDGDERLMEVTITPDGANGGSTTLRGAIHDITDRRERQRELRQLRQAIDNANVPITLADPAREDDPLVYVNDGFEEMTGYPPEETLGRNCRFLQGEDTDPEKVATLREAIDNEETISVELRNYRKDGTEFWNRLTVSPIYDDGELVRYLGTQEDVTARKERERELRAERQFTEQALDALDDVFYVLDTDGSLRRWNEQVSQVTGYADSELADMQAVELFAGDDRKTITDAIETVISGDKVTVEAHLLTADGECRPYEFTGARLTDVDGQTTGLVGIGRDLTERKQRERRFQALVENSSDIVSIVDADGVFQYQSPSVKRILGYEPEETIGDTAWEYVHPDDRADLVKAFERGVADEQQNPVVEYRARHADGSWRWLEAHGNNQLDNPAVEGYIVNSRDITARKKREKELERTRDLLSDIEELAGIGSWEYDSGTERLVLTDGARQIYQLGADTDPTLEDAFEYLHPEDRERLTDRFDACLETGEPYEVDVRLTTAEGAKRWVTAQGRRVEKAGSDSVVRGYIQDVTEKKTQEQQLTELNEVSKDLSLAETHKEVADVGVKAARSVLNLQANAVHLCESDQTQLAPVARTDRLRTLLDEVPSLSTTDSIAGRVYRRGEPTVAKDVRRDDDVYDTETDLRGHIYLPLGEHGVLIAGSEERVAFDQQDLALGEILAENLTAALERIDRERTTRRQQQQLSLFFSESPLGAIQWDDEFRVKRLNDRAEEILGYEEAELRGESWETIVDEGDRDHVANAVDDLLTADGGTRVINKNTRKTGETRLCKWHNRVVTDADGDVQTIFSKFEDVTEQENRKRELRAVNDQYQALVENFPNGAVFLYDTDHRVIRAGGSELASVGLSPEAVEGTTPRDRYPPEIAEELVDQIGKAFAGDGSTFEQEYDGEHYRVQMVPIRTDDEEITRVMAVSENITERKERRQELERYERLVENLPVGVFRTTIDGEIVDANEAATDIYGADSRAQLRETGAEELYGDDSDRIDLLDQVQATGRVENELVEFETLEGDRRFVRVTLTLNDEAERRYLEGILQDVTDRRELEREFTQIKTIAESLNDAVYVIDDDGQFTYVNDEFTELTGYSEETILGSTPGLVKDDETVEEAERQLGRLLSDDGPDTVTFETIIQPADGDPVVCEDNMGVLPYEGDSFEGSVGVLRNITERKRREQELRRERNRLDEFASVVSHDLRNPLSVAQGNLELLDAEHDTQKIEQIEQAHSRMNELIDDLLTLARQGETVSDVEPVALGELAETCWRTIESSDALLHVETDRTIQCDPSRLKELLGNLYRNAVEHGGPNIAVTVGPVDNGFYLEDTGPGIPEDKRDQVFEAGYSTATDGTGFGLRIVNQVVSAHGWDIAITEGEQGGARFEITGVKFTDQ